MKKLFALIAVFGMLFMGASIFAQDETTDSPVTEDTTQVAEEVAAAAAAEAEVSAKSEETPPTA